MNVAFYISGHGLGHAVRQIEVMHALRRRAPDVRIVIRTSAPEWLFQRSAPAGAVFEPAEVDTGAVQRSSLEIDELATAREAARFYGSFDTRVDDEAYAIRQMHADVVVGDIPPLASAAAARAEVPSMAIGNFTWDWIYSIYESFPANAPGVMEIIRGAYAHAGVALRLPLHGGFDAMTAVTRDIPFIARRSSRDRGEVRRLLNVPDDRPAILVSFGDYGHDIPLDPVRAAFTLVTPPRVPSGVAYEDIVAACDVVLSKPGYGIVSDCIAHGVPLLYTSRGRFAEYDVFVREMPRYLRCRFISQEDLRAGRWYDAIASLLAQPTPPSEPPRLDGADVAADVIAANVK